MESEKNTSSGENLAIKFLLPVSLQQAFNNILKSGIYKELHKREMLSDVQLAELLNHCKRQE